MSVAVPDVSRCVPNIRMVLAGSAASTAAWIDSPGPTTVARWAGSADADTAAAAEAGR